MSNHPNRSKRTDALGRNPTAAEIVGRRIEANLTKPEAAKLIHVSLRSWEEWEAGRTRMHPNHWRAFVADTQPLIARSPAPAHRPG